MMRMKLLLMLVAIALVAGTAQANLLVNPGFEEGSFAGTHATPDFWAHYYTSYDAVHTWVNDSDEAHSGEKYMKMYNWLVYSTTWITSAWLGQDVPGMKEDGDYTFTVWAKNAAEDQTNLAAVEVEWLDSLGGWIRYDFVTIPVTDPDWIEVDFGAFTAPEGTVAATIWLAAPISNGLNAICYDDVTLLGPDPNVDAGPDMISWDGATVSLTGSETLEGEYSTIIWTADPNDGAVITNGNTLTPTVQVALTIGDRPEATIANHSFENGLDNWVILGGDGHDTWNGAAPDTADANYLKVYVTPTDGHMCAYLDGVTGEEAGVLSQVLANTLAANRTYTLEVDVVNDGVYEENVGYGVQLLAGETVIAEDDDEHDLDTYGVWATSTVNYSTGATPAELGEPLEIRLVAKDGTNKMNFDNVHLTADPNFPSYDPNVHTYELTLDVDGKYDVMKIDVYPDACAAKLAAGREATDLVGDDCITDLADLAEVVATWPDHNALTEPTAKEDSSFAAVANYNGLIAYWPFDEGTGDIAYDAIGDNDAQITGCTWLLPGKIGDAAIDFADDAGSGDEVNCGPDAIKDPDLTVAFWIRANDIAHMRAIYAGPDEYSTEPGWRVLLLDTRGVLFRVHGTDGDLDGGDLRIDEAVYEADTWVHMTFTLDSETRELNGYVNGELKGTTTVVESCSVATTGVDLLLGTYSGILDALDEVAIWNIALTPNQVRNVYESGVLSLITARNPSPSNGAYVYPVSELELGWTNTAPFDPDDPEVVYDPNGPVWVDVWFGTDPNDYNDYNKIVGATTSAGENADSVTVDANGLGTYYWQVNSYIYGNPAEVDYNDATDPNSDPGGLPIAEGFMWRFHAATDVPVSVEAVDMVTWSGEPVVLDPNIDDDGVSPLTYHWRASDPNVVFDPNEFVEDPTVTITKDFSVIPIANHSFEDPVRADGTQGSLLGWIRPDSWAMVWNPGDDTDGSDAYDGIAPDGENIMWVNGVGAVSQILADTLTAGTTYELSVYVGVNAYYRTSTYKVQLVAGGTVLAEDDNSIPLTTDTFERSTMTYTYDPELHPALLGEPLQIHLWCTKPLGEANFDDVHLTVDPPRPFSGAVTTVTLTVTAEDDAGSDKDTMTIDVYDTACPAAIIGLGREYDPGDFDIDCDTDLKDFAVLAEEWLVNNELTGSIVKP